MLFISGLAFHVVGRARCTPRWDSGTSLPVTRSRFERTQFSERISSPYENENIPEENFGEEKHFSHYCETFPETSERLLDAALFLYFRKHSSENVRERSRLAPCGPPRGRPVWTPYSMSPAVAETQGHRHPVVATDQASVIGVTEPAQPMRASAQLAKCRRHGGFSVGFGEGRGEVALPVD